MFDWPVGPTWWSRPISDLQFLIGRLGVLVGVVPVVEQQAQHGGVLQGVLQGGGERRVVDDPEVAVDLGAVRQQQAHHLMPGATPPGGGQR